MHPPLPVTVLLLLLLPFAVPPPLHAKEPPLPADWRAAIYPGPNRASVDDALGLIAAVHRGMTPEAARRDRAVVEMVNTLVTSTSLPFTDDELPGAWRCRSIQGGRDIVVAYPFFACRIERREGRPYLSKTTGSQFRTGFLFPDGPNQRRIFLGNQYVRGDRPLRYSGFYPKDQVDGESTVHDSVGVLVKKGPGHFVLILDASAEQYEVYDLVR